MTHICYEHLSMATINFFKQMATTKFVVMFKDVLSTVFDKCMTLLGYVFYPKQQKLHTHYWDDNTSKPIWLLIVQETKFGNNTISAKHMLPRMWMLHDCMNWQIVIMILKENLYITRGQICLCFGASAGRVSLWWLSRCPFYRWLFLFSMQCCYCTLLLLN